MACERGPVDVAAPAGTAEVTVMALMTPTVDTRASNLVAARSNLTTVSSRYAKLPSTLVLVCLAQACPHGLSATRLAICCGGAIDRPVGLMRPPRHGTKP